jgi:hypothetical protein
VRHNRSVIPGHSTSDRIAVRHAKPSKTCCNRHGDGTAGTRRRGAVAISADFTPKRNGGRNETPPFADQRPEKVRLTARPTFHGREPGLPNAVVGPKSHPLGRYSRRLRRENIELAPKTCERSPFEAVASRSPLARPRLIRSAGNGPAAPRVYHVVREINEMNIIAVISAGFVCGSAVIVPAWATWARIKEDQGRHARLTFAPTASSRVGSH